MKGIPRFNLWLLAILCWIASYALIRAGMHAPYLALGAAALLLGGIVVVRRKRVSVDPVAAGDGRSALHYYPICMAALAVLIFTSGWLSWLPQPAGAAVQSWHEWEFGEDGSELAMDDATFNPSAPSLPRARGGQRTGLNWLWGESGPGPLPSRLDLSLSNDLAGFLSCNDGPEAFWLSQGRVYIKHFSFSEFDGRRWFNQRGERLRIPVDDSGWSWIRSKPAPTARALAIDCELTFETASDQALPLLQGAMGVEAPIAIDQGGIIYAGAKPERSELIYQALSLPRVWKDVRGNFTVDREGVGETYLIKAKGELGRLIEAIVTQEFSDAENDLQQLDRLMAWMQSEFSYSLETENRRSINPIRNFLSFERQGHCELFATTTALVLREMGIPSRVCYGHARGQFLTVSNLFAFRDRDAHAWAEIYLKGYGWTIFDTTPVGDLGAPTELSTPTTAGQLDQEYAGYEEPSPTEDDASAAIWLPDSFDGALLGSGLGLLCFALIASAWLGNRTPRASKVDQQVPGYLAKIRKLALESGISNPASYPLRELAEKLVENGVCSEALDDSVAYHYQSTYEAGERREGYEVLLANRLG